MPFSVTPLTGGSSAHLPNVCVVTESVALPGFDGLAVTFALNVLVLQVAENVVPSAKLTLVFFTRPAFSTAPFLTAGPPVFPTVSTGLDAAGCALAAYAALAGRASTMTPAVARIK